jgi:hypothetical protein
MRELTTENCEIPVRNHSGREGMTGKSVKDHLLANVFADQAEGDEPGKSITVNDE